MNEKLARLALQAREKAYAPYSGFRVGAAVLCDSGEIYTGANVENASYGLTNCAERSAVFAAVSAGERRIVSVAIAGGKDGETAYTMPCGACRQVLSEFASKDCTVLLVQGETDYQTHALSALLPHAFGKGEKDG